MRLTRRGFVAAAASLLLLSGCKGEPTSPDEMDPGEVMNDISEYVDMPEVTGFMARSSEFVDVMPTSMAGPYDDVLARYEDLCDACTALTSMDEDDVPLGASEVHAAMCECAEEWHTIAELMNEAATTSDNAVRSSCYDAALEHLGAAGDALNEATDLMNEASDAVAEGE